MPPKKATTSKSKRKAESDDDATRDAKRPKAAPESSSVQPTNKVLPTEINFPKKLAGTVRIASWNVAGLAAAQKKGFKHYVEAEDPDILILTETKANDVPMDPVLNEKYEYRTWAISSKKGYSGTAVLSKFEPISVTKNLPGYEKDDIVKGRIVTVEFESCYLIATYVPNAGMGLKTLDVKNEWNGHFEKYIRELDTKKPVIWVGDLNVAPTEKDLKNAKTNWNKTPGYTEDETKAFANILNPPEGTPNAGKFVDIWREQHPDDRHYTYFGYRFNAREKGIGWRLDMFVLSERIVEKAKLCEIRSEIYGASDHCPLVMEFEGPL